MLTRLGRDMLAALHFDADRTALVNLIGCLVKLMRIWCSERRSAAYRIVTSGSWTCSSSPFFCGGRRQSITDLAILRKHTGCAVEVTLPDSILARSNKC